MKIYHNPRCTKSREALQLLTDNGLEPEVLLYMKDTLTEKELKATLEKLKIKAVDLIRKGEKIFKEEFKGKTLSESEWISAMIKYPKLMERPIVIQGSKAVIGRPPVKVLDLL